MAVLLNPKAWIAIAFAALLALVGLQQIRVSHYKAQVAEVRTELASDRAKYAQAAQAAEAAARAEESRREAEKQEVIDAARKQSEDAIAAVGRADAAADGLRRQLARYVAAVRAAGADTGTAGGSPPAGDAIGVLADVFGRADSRAGELAKGLDAARIAGLACERSYDALIKP